MKLDRNIEGHGKVAVPPGWKLALLGKYALVKLRMTGMPAQDGDGNFLIPEDAIDFGPAGSDSEFVVIRLKDIHAGIALRAYADSVLRDPAGGEEEREYGLDVLELAWRADARPDKKRPD